MMEPVLVTETYKGPEHSFKIEGSDWRDMKVLIDGKELEYVKSLEFSFSCEAGGDTVLKVKRYVPKNRK